MSATPQCSHTSPARSNRMTSMSCIDTAFLIAQALGIDVGAVPSLIVVAERKLAMLFNPAAQRAP